MLTEYKKHFRFYLPIIFYGRQFDIHNSTFVAGWHIVFIGVGYNSWSFQVARGSKVLRANKNQYSSREPMDMSRLKRLFAGGY